MKTLMILLVIVPMCFAVCFWEYFPSSTYFPPSGWLIVSEGPGFGNWYWSDTGQPGNGYAHGAVVVNGPSETSATSTLKTSPFSLFVGDNCHVDFYMKGSSDGYQVSFGRQVLLFNGTNIVASYNLPETAPWSHQILTFQNISTASSNYRIGWKLTASCSPILYAGGMASFDLDTIHLYDESVALEPTSLGRIKGAFH